MERRGELQGGLVCMRWDSGVGDCYEVEARRRFQKATDDKVLSSLPAGLKKRRLEGADERSRTGKKSNIINSKGMQKGGSKSIVGT